MNYLTEYKKEVEAENWRDSWFITITLNPSMYKLKARNQLKKTFGDIKHCFKMMSDQYFIMAELTKQSNIHYHAIARFKEGNTLTMAQCFIEILREKPKFGMCKINDEQLTEDVNVNRSIGYLFKDSDKNDKVINFTGYGKNPTEHEICDFSGRHQGVNKIISDSKKAVVSLARMCLDAGVSEDDEPTPPLSDFEILTNKPKTGLACYPIDDPEFRPWDLPTEELREEYHNYINKKKTFNLI